MHFPLSKSELVAELEDCVERVSGENDKLKSERSEKDELLRQYSQKLEESNSLLKQSSATNKKLQKRLHAKKQNISVSMFSEHCVFCRIQNGPS